MSFFHFVNSVFMNVNNIQEGKGVKKYGKHLNPMDDYDWLEMAEEELVDGFKYLVAEREKRDNIIRTVEEDLEQALHTGEPAYHILQALEDLKKLK